jgi:hypothetical protein
VPVAIKLLDLLLIKDPPAFSFQKILQILAYASMIPAHSPV